MAASNLTVLATKQSFTVYQARILTETPLDASRAWHAKNDASDDGLTPHAVEYALFRANQVLQKHCRRVYNPQGARHVAEQIDRLYTRSGLQEDREGDPDGNAKVVGAEVDLTDEASISKLPDSWPSEEQVQQSPQDAAEYSRLAEHIKALSKRRAQIQARVGRLRRLRKTIQPLSSLVPASSSNLSEGGLQENLITRGHELERELERMKILLARVGGRLSLLPEHHESPVFTAADSAVTWASLDKQSDEKLTGVLKVL